MERRPAKTKQFSVRKSAERPVSSVCFARLSIAVRANIKIEHRSIPSYSIPCFSVISHARLSRDNRTNSTDASVVGELAESVDDSRCLTSFGTTKSVMSTYIRNRVQNYSNRRLCWSNIFWNYWCTSNEIELTLKTVRITLRMYWK